MSAVAFKKHLPETERKRETHARTHTLAKRWVESHYLHWSAREEVSLFSLFFGPRNPAEEEHKFSFFSAKGSRQNSALKSLVGQT